MSPSSRNLLFVCGTPRSGTTAMHALLAGDDRIALGMERYGSYLGADFNEGLFTKERFFDFDTDPRDANRKNAAYLETAKRNFDSATYIGDKIPLLYLAHSRVSAVFPDAKYVVILRNIVDICNSYKTRKENPNDNWTMDIDEAITHWNQLLDFLTAEKGDPQIHVVMYEDFFSDISGYKKLYEFLGFEFDASCEARYFDLLEKTRRLEDRRTLLLNDAQKLMIFKTANMGLYQTLLGRDVVVASAKSPAARPAPKGGDATLDRQDVIAAARIFLGEQELTDATIESLVGATGEEALNYFMKSQAFQDNDFNARLVVGMAKEIRTRVKTV